MCFECVGDTEQMWIKNMRCSSQKSKFGKNQHFLNKLSIFFLKIIMFINNLCLIMFNKLTKFCQKITFLLFNAKITLQNIYNDIKINQSL